MSGPLIVEVRRGGIVESRHRVHAAVVDAEGRLLHATGDADLLTFMRSAFKPLQAAACLVAGVEARFGVRPEELAVACASHVGSDEHVAVVAGLLERTGGSPEELTCGAHEPLDSDARRRLAGGRPTVLHSNCSGKHALMTAACRAAGWPVEGYARPDHPLQQRILELAARAAGVPRDELRFGVDGCGLPAPAFTLRQMASIFAQMSAGGASLTEEERAAVRRVIAAMRAHPHLTRGRGHFPVELMERARLWAKPGADGVLCVGPETGDWGFALKVEDGGSRAEAPAAMALLERFGLLRPEEAEALARWRRPPLRNVAGDVVGEIAVAEGSGGRP
ncbi:MAG: asparaginase [Firmicutes bacterium]|nr:asparaginase [Bacillota bacterium]